jgi:hypothetical protein
VKRYGSWHPACAGRTVEAAQTGLNAEETACSSGLTKVLGKAEDPAAAARNCKKDPSHYEQVVREAAVATVEEYTASSASLRPVSTRVLEFPRRSQVWLVCLEEWSNFYAL